MVRLDLTLAHYYVGGIVLNSMDAFLCCTISSFSLLQTVFGNFHHIVLLVNCL